MLVTYSGVPYSSWPLADEAAIPRLRQVASQSHRPTRAKRRVLGRDGRLAAGGRHGSPRVAIAGPHHSVSQRRELEVAATLVQTSRRLARRSRDRGSIASAMADRPTCTRHHRRNDAARLKTRHRNVGYPRDNVAQFRRCQSPRVHCGGAKDSGSIHEKCGSRLCPFWLIASESAVPGPASPEMFRTLRRRNGERRSLSSPC
jgi:hypothetical protein